MPHDSGIPASLSIKCAAFILAKPEDKATPGGDHSAKLRGYTVRQ